MGQALVSRVAKLYSEIESQLQERPDLAGQCKACGRCCDFESYDHRLFVTPAELEYLAFHVGNIKRMQTRRCPYNADGRCTVYEYRFAGCRIFCCHGDKDFQSQVSEWAVKELKSLCRQFDIPYRYAELSAAIGSCATGICQPAGGRNPGGHKD